MLFRSLVVLYIFLKAHTFSLVYKTINKNQFYTPQPFQIHEVVSPLFIECKKEYVQVDGSFLSGVPYDDDDQIVLCIHFREIIHN